MPIFIIICYFQLSSIIFIFLDYFLGFGWHFEFHKWIDLCLAISFCSDVVYRVLALVEIYFPQVYEIYSTEVVRKHE